MRRTQQPQENQYEIEHYHSNNMKSDLIILFHEIDKLKKKILSLEILVFLGILNRILSSI